MTITEKLAAALEINKVNRALELRVIDWLQFAEFPESLIKTPDDSDMAQLTLILLNERKQFNARLAPLHLAFMECVQALECNNQVLMWDRRNEALAHLAEALK